MDIVVPISHIAMQFLQYYVICFFTRHMRWDSRMFDLYVSLAGRQMNTISINKLHHKTCVVVHPFLWRQNETFWNIRSLLHFVRECFKCNSLKKYVAKSSPIKTHPKFSFRKKPGISLFGTKNYIRFYWQKGSRLATSVIQPRGLDENSQIEENQVFV